MTATAPNAEHGHREMAGYWERVQKVFYMLDFRLAFITANQALDAVGKINEMEAKCANGVTLSSKEMDEKLRLERIRNAAVHPQTGEPIFTPLRLSMIVPVNLMLDGLMLGAKTPFQTVFAQWLNQSYNAFHYYANRNTTNSETASQRLAAYAAATLGSVGVAVYLKTGGVKSLQRFAPFCAVAAADVLNLGIMRKSEFLDGIHVYDLETEELVGTSKRAGLLATGSCIFARVAAAFPILAGTPMVVEQIEKRSRIFLKYPLLRMPVMLSVVGVMIQLAVPVTFGVFRQDMVIDVKHLEPEFALTSAQKVFFNKGL